MSEVIVTSKGNLQNEVRYGAEHSFTTDEPVAAGGEDTGPDSLHRCCSPRSVVVSR